MTTILMKYVYFKQSSSILIFQKTDIHILPFAGLVHDQKIPAGHSLKGPYTGSWLLDVDFWKQIGIVGKTGWKNLFPL